jgi:hypothetical protein
MENNSIVDYLNSRGLASDFASRKKLAEASGNLNYVGSAMDNIDLLTKEKAKAAGNKVYTPSTNAGISVNQLQKETPINVPAPAPAESASTYMNPITGAATGVQTALDQVNRQYKSAYDAQMGAASDISKSMEFLLGKTADTATANQVAGVTQSTEDLYKYANELERLNAEASAITRQSQAIPLVLQDQATGKGITDAGLAPQQAGELRKNAIRALTLAQQADITQAAATGALNKLNEAKARAQQIIDLKYKPIEDSLNVRMKQYELAKDVLTSIDKERTNLLDTKLKQEQSVLNYYKDQEKAKSDLIIKASPYAPQALLQRASEAKDAQSAAMILGTYAGDYLATQKLNQEIIKLQIENGTYNANSTNLYGKITKDNGYDMEAFKRGIEAVESLGSGGYSALGKVMETGAYKGDRAYGKYQVMGKNIPEWTKSALGYSMTPQQFLANPDAQEKVFEYQSELNYAKYGNWDDVASVWFSGKPLMGNTASDGTTTVPQYVQKMRKGMGVTTSQKSFSQEAISLSQAIDRGEYKDLNAIPAKFQSEVAQYRATQPNKVALAQANELKTQLDSVKNAKDLLGGFRGLGGFMGIGAANVAGSNFLGRIDLGNFLSGDKAKTLGYIDNLLSGATLQKLIDAKSAGATFGALSNQELSLLETSANVLNQWAIRDEKTNKLLGFSVSDGAVIDELNKLQSKYEKGASALTENDATSQYFRRMQQTLDGSVLQNGALGGYNY